jgi:hypothetical protein
MIGEARCIAPPASGKRNQSSTMSSGACGTAGVIYTLFDWPPQYGGRLERGDRRCHIGGTSLFGIGGVWRTVLGVPIIKSRDRSHPHRPGLHWQRITIGIVILAVMTDTLRRGRRGKNIWRCRIERSWKGEWHEKRRIVLALLVSSLVVRSCSRGGGGCKKEGKAHLLHRFRPTPPFFIELGRRRGQVQGAVPDFTSPAEMKPEPRQGLENASSRGRWDRHVAHRRAL